MTAEIRRCSPTLHDLAQTRSNAQTERAQGPNPPTHDRRRTPLRPHVPSRPQTHIRLAMRLAHHKHLRVLRDQPSAVL